MSQRIQFDFVSIIVDVLFIVDRFDHLNRVVRHFLGRFSEKINQIFIPTFLSAFRATRTKTKLNRCDELSLDFRLVFSNREKCSSSRRKKWNSTHNLKINIFGDFSSSKCYRWNFSIRLFSFFFVPADFFRFSSEIKYSHSFFSLTFNANIKRRLSNRTEEKGNRQEFD